MTAGELANATGIGLATLCYWITRGVVSVEGGGTSGHPFQFDLEAILRVLLIAKLREQGVPLQTVHRALRSNCFPLANVYLTSILVTTGGGLIGITRADVTARYSGPDIFHVDLCALRRRANSILGTSGERDSSGNGAGTRRKERNLDPTAVAV